MLGREPSRGWTCWPQLGHRNTTLQNQHHIVASHLVDDGAGPMCNSRTFNCLMRHIVPHISGYIAKSQIPNPRS